MSKNLFLKTKLGQTLKRTRKLSAQKLFIRIGNEEDIIELIIRFNTEGEPTSQLFELGVDSNGTDLGEYTPFTIEQKLAKGQPIDRITLKDDGGFYKSWRVKATQEGWEFSVDPIKDDTNLIEEWGEDIVGLFPPNLKRVIRILLNRYRQETLRIIQGG